MLHLLALAHATPGELTLPLDAWTTLQPKPHLTPTPDHALPLERSIVGRVENGMLQARLQTRVRALQAVSMPVLPSEVTLVEARLNGRPATFDVTSAYTVDLPAGTHSLQVDLLHGQASDRSERRITLDLPDGGATSFDLWLPESSIDVTLTTGVLTSTQARDGGTQVKGWLDGGATLDLVWERRAAQAVQDAKLDTTAMAMLDLTGDLVTGRATYNVQILSGEVDRVAFALPEGVEVTGVKGTDVLQWHTSAGALQVLLRSVADSAVSLEVGYQYPAEHTASTALQLPLPQGSVHGALGVVAPVAIEVGLDTVEDAEKLDTRDVPQDLVELSVEPLRAAISFEAAPTASASTTRRGEVLTSGSRIDDLQGITMLMQDGTELGKLRLVVRNADRQVLGVDLPEGSRLTHCFRDGVPLRPAAESDDPDRVLVPLTRSARSERRKYTVQAGDTLSAIAADNYGSANLWQQVATFNPAVHGDNLQIGTVLDLPVLGEVDTESFVLELGWERSTEALSSIGRRDLALPGLDLDVQAATWHLYLPDHIETLSVDTNVTQVSGLHSDPLTRMVGFLVHSGALGSDAWAGGDYRNALKSRRSSYFAQDQETIATPMSAYPLVGKRIRFRGNLLGTEAPRASVRYVSDRLANGVHWAVMLLAGVLGLGLALRPRSVRALGALAGGTLCTAVLGHYLLGTWWNLVLGLNLGLIAGAAPGLWRTRRVPRTAEVVAGVTIVMLLPLATIVLLLLKATWVPVVTAAGLFFVARRNA